ncbi:isoleucine--tRNA ligase [Novosphingobium mangrovi (ex Hu et al. 2023)]|uniref:Isoleucine--tRNA ligase n=1 Tax=Novosphingobium mangrovi (ex Hu et al. 2023) TaxID=2930094 RepID=A0ABT0AAT1_9SPHN|nr:isoleucine--tRNA ligase [Novosphingobium mangrovi (ex Hu et al. 2023)]MCJ1960302.1 isoleucine--tRNA ligase [Novosphingobium mangrovi (ex Hu et al. 2023)]
MTEQRDYKDTVFLPKTDFPMKAGLAQKEPGILSRWENERIYDQVRAARAGREKFILHDGPPYANGDMHIGHALNHILKDMVVRTQTLLGKDAPYVPGWDCHGLPIEWKVEEAYRKKKKNKDEVPAEEFRAECRAYARQWVDTQREQLKRLGINGNWDQPYLTMDFDAEATIVTELLKFAQSNMLYRGAKPVMWSPVEKTALAEAEVEYEDIVSTQIDVAFEIVESQDPDLIGAYAVIWTTTPWTIPVNQALAYGSHIDYHLIEADGRRYLIAEPLVDAFVKRLGHETHDLHFFMKGAGLEGTKVRHPMHHLGGFYAELRPMLAGDFVTTDSGTGLVHLAPDHGEDDFDLCKANGLNPKFVVEADGRYREDWLWLPRTDERSASVINPRFTAPDGPICSDLKEAGALLSASADYSHSYPHSWRSKAKVIYRCTPQWFVPMDTPSATSGMPDGMTLRETAEMALAHTRFVPAKGRNRIGAMVQGRPDWVLSRQRAWGVPITLFVNRTTGEYLVDEAVNARIIAAIRESGVDAWSDERAQEYLGEAYKAEDYERVVDILDVWFDSGSTHAFVLESGKWPELLRPEGYEGPHADLYLEGSDQHRGWFQSSLLEACATRGHAPYKAVLTHGFTMDAKGFKMSKSLGNTISPIKVMETSGADIIRLWALSVDFTEDHRIGDEILKGVGDQYRRLRNTFRYMLGALSDFAEDERVALADMPELERYMLALLADLDADLKQAVADYDFNTYVRRLLDFCNEDLSAFFFDIRKDRLYCDDPASLERRAYRTALDTLFHALVRYAAPVTVFTAEEVWTSRYPEGGSVHLLEWPEVPAPEADKDTWAALRALREKVTEAIEPLRREKTVRSSLEAEVTVPASAVPEGFSDADLAALFITATVSRGQGEDVTVTKTTHHKCGRCWRLLPEVSEDGALCGRCEDVVDAPETAA